MPSKISQAQIIDATITGIQDAAKTYERWSGGEWLAFTAEHVISGFIAKSIMGIPGSKYIEIEPRCKEIIKAASENRRGKLAAACRPEGHIDMCLWWAKNYPRAIIEIKNNVYNYSGQCDADIKRIISCLRAPNTTIKFGLFAFYSSADDGKVKSAKEKLEGRFNNICKRIKDEYGKNFRINGSQKVQEVGKSAWAASCIIIK